LHMAKKRMKFGVWVISWILGHSRPKSCSGYVITPALARALEGIEADFVFCGHTHLPMVRKIGRKTFANPGSVGLPLDGDPRASYAIWYDGKG
jgi:predicted phosphodiesterase